MEHLLQILYMHYIIMSAETYLWADTIYYLSFTDKNLRKVYKVHCHLASKLQFLALNPGSLTVELLNGMLY